MYDVFLSFRGEDTRLSFTSHLAKALCDLGISTFFDDAELKKGRGEEISMKSSLMKAIEESMISIIVFSENYASSSFCLDELVYILDSFEKKKRRQFVFPIFYDVDPSVVRHQKGIYGQALDAHENNFFKSSNSKNANAEKKLKQWKIALTQAANLSGWHFKHGYGRVTTQAYYFYHQFYLFIYFS